MTAASEPWRAWVIDAVTGEPVPDVLCELWTEGLEAPAELGASATSSADGSFELPLGRGEKLLLRKPGYRSTVQAFPEDEFRLETCAEPFVLRVLDLEDRPVADAAVRTHQTCRHAPPAVAGATAADGRVSFPDFPPARDHPELEVLAQGHAALGMLHLSELPPDGVLHLPRRAPVRVRLLDTDGQPLADRRCTYESDTGWTAFETDGEGRAVIASTFADRRIALQERHAGRSRNIGDGYPPGREEWTLRPDAAELPATGLARLWLWLDVPIEQEGGAHLRVLHDEGWMFEGAGEHAVPPGGMRVVVGAAFTGVRERITRLTLAPGEERALELSVEPEPRLEVLLPDGEASWWRVHVQAGDDSVTHASTGGRLALGVPPGEPVIVLAQGVDVRRMRLEPWSGSATADLRAPETLVRPMERAGGER